MLMFEENTYKNILLRNVVGRIRLIKKLMKFYQTLNNAMCS